MWWERAPSALPQNFRRGSGSMLGFCFGAPSSLSMRLSLFIQTPRDRHRCHLPIETTAVSAQTTIRHKPFHELRTKPSTKLPQPSVTVARYACSTEYVPCLYALNCGARTTKRNSFPVKLRNCWMSVNMVKTSAGKGLDGSKLGCSSKDLGWPPAH